jgi:hypothetical protein
MMIFAGACALFGALFLPETYAPVLLAKKVRHPPISENKKNPYTKYRQNVCALLILRRMGIYMLKAKTLNGV